MSCEGGKRSMNYRRNSLDPRTRAFLSQTLVDCQHIRTRMGFSNLVQRNNMLRRCVFARTPFPYLLSVKHQCLLLSLCSETITKREVCRLHFRGEPCDCSPSSMQSASHSAGAL